MICHRHRCIFIHIPRAAGTSIEQWIVGRDWWQIDPSTKHLLASQAKRLYAAHWDSYFKFALVRNPWDRMASCLRYAQHFGITYDGKTLDFRGYKERFGYPVLVEHDFRFSRYEHLVSARHREHRVYLNILDEELDFVGTVENLTEDARKIQETLGIQTALSHHVERRPAKRPYQEYYDDDSKRVVEHLFRDDIAAFGYRF